MPQGPQRLDRTPLQDLVDTINDHITEQDSHQPSRPSSRGTMIVDWDGSGVPIVSYRNRPSTNMEVSRNQGGPDELGNWGREPRGENVVAPLQFRQRSSGVEPPTSSTSSHHAVHIPAHRSSDSSRQGRLPTGPGMSHTRSHAVQQHTSQAQNQTQSDLNPKVQQGSVILLKYKGAGPDARIQGFDPQNRIQYSYDGRILHLHRSARTGQNSLPESSRQTNDSDLSEYYELRIEDWDPSKPICVQDVDEDLPKLPHERTRKQKVFRFVRNVVEAMGVRGLMARLRDDHRRKLGVVPPHR